MQLPLSDAPKSCIYGDAVYTDYGLKDDMLEADGVHLKISRKSNSKRPDEPCARFLREQKQEKN